MRRRKARTRTWQFGNLQGIAAVVKKLTPAQVTFIRDCYAMAKKLKPERQRGPWGMRKRLCRMFGISTRQVNHIISGRDWRRLRHRSPEYAGALNDSPEVRLAKASLPKKRTRGRRHPKHRTDALGDRCT